VTNPLLKDAIPQLAMELVALLEHEGETDLAAQVPELRLFDRCRCGDDFCATVYTGPRPRGEWGPENETVALNPEEGLLILDVLDGKITCIEVLVIPTETRQSSSARRAQAGRAAVTT
jgi:hypothetical protein